MILLIDNYDSFTFNLYQYLCELGEEVLVKRNDELTIENIEELNPSAIVLSPGPGRPENAGILIEVIQHFYNKKPILGVCLGHQAIAAAFGGEVVRAGNIKHGKTSLIRHNNSALFQYIPQPVEVMRYHSLVVKKESLPPVLSTAALSMDDQEIMALEHFQYPVFGVQFHPESIGTKLGKKIMKNFILLKEESENERVSTKII
ncbi:aminodeoxychorismate/anthranilate synthase component II [Rossellomorea vietnamensis]|uniref:Aminodeoxychorismate/anthranilate synthase component II n=1 Tax=Rossellomorea vietnamensis TaxID=218284 RepID=A0A5D4KBP1_9BACI|nr:aminodeoxychorismate/anthranilate synthase component II [Rossellomorea vietnamensis]TYR74085.1 aminodeoxychorismate/anthranilate synthase component II [Rossellomorea vietnamensis]